MTARPPKLKVGPSRAVLAADPILPATEGRPKESPAPLAANRTDLWEQLKEANAGYNSRDSLVPDLFGRTVTIFGGMSAILLGFVTLADPLADWLLLGIVTLIAVAGGLGLLAVTEDLASTGRVKQNFRLRASKARAALGWPELDPKEKTPKFGVERFVERFMGRRPEAEIRLYVFVAYALQALWWVQAVLVAVAVVLGVGAPEALP